MAKLGFKPRQIYNISILVIIIKISFIDEKCWERFPGGGDISVETGKMSKK